MTLSFSADDPVPYFPRYLTPLAAAAVVEAEAAGLDVGPVRYTLTPQAEATLEAEPEAGQ